MLVQRSDPGNLPVGWASGDDQDQARDRALTLSVWAVSIDSSQIWRTDLVVLVAQTEVLQELVGQPHQLVHPHVLLGIKRNLQ